MGEEQTGAERADRRPAALLPAPVARLGGFAALALLGVLQWQRMVAGLPVGRALLWVLAAVAAGVGVLWAQTRARRPSLALPAVTLGALLGAYAASGLDLGLLKPRRWDELGDGVARGVEALGSVRLPYVGADPWPGLALQLLGAMLCVLAALVAFWPREREPGYPFLSLAALLVLVAAPIVSLGGTRQVALGVVLAALTIAFLWLERLPLRPGVGVAVLLALAVAGALPFASVADREEPWFDYKSFAEGLGPDDPLRFSWNHAYGPIDWPRDGNEVLRVATAKPSYWKVRNLEEFDGEVWRDGGAGFGGNDPELELPPDWRDRPDWTDELRISIRRMRTTDVVGAGTNVRVTSPGRRVRPANEPGMWSAVSEFRRGDSYTVEAHIPRPTGAQLTQGATGAFGEHAEALALTVPFRWTAKAPRAPRGTPVRAAQVRFPPFRPGGAGARAAPRAEYPTLNRWGSGSFALRNSPYARTWQLARRLRRQADTPFAYVLAVDRLLKRDFTYDEIPPLPRQGRAPLDAFLFDSKAGYCQHFSGAMALLLRMGGIPARVVTGFSPGGYSKRKQAWIVRDTDAHSWVEVWFDAWGWVTFDPTPEATPARSQIAALEAAAAPVDSDDDAQNTSGGDGAADDSRDVREDLLRDPAASAGADAAGAGGGPAWWWYALAAVAVLALAGWLFLRLRRRGRPEVDRAVAELEAALRRSGRPAPVGTTLQQLEQRFGGSPEAMAYLRALRAGRYGVTAPETTTAQRRALRRELASGLGASGWLRALWALPPWRA